MPKLLMSVCLSLFFCTGAVAQYEPILEFGFGPGVSIYQGDLSPHRLGSYKRPGLGLQIFGQATFSYKFSARLNYSFSSLHERDNNYTYAYKPFRNFFFETTVNELSLQLVYNPLANNGEEDLNRLIPYFFVGAGISKLSINRDWSKFNYGWPEWQSWVRPGLAADSLKAMPSFAATLPIGVGLKYIIGENVSLFAEAGHRLTNQEYLDGFSMSANPKRKDAFTTVTAGLIFRRL